MASYNSWRTCRSSEVLPMRRLPSRATLLVETVPRIVDTSPLGAALLASVAAGLQPGLAEAACEVAGEAKTLEPDSSGRGAYDKAYAAYRKLFDSLRPMFETTG